MILTFTLSGGIALLLLIILLLLGVRKKDISHHLLIAIFSTVCCFFLLFWAEMEEVEWLYTTCFILSDSISLFLGPLFLLFVLRILSVRPPRYALLLHFIPFLLHWGFITLPLGIFEHGHVELPVYLHWIGDHGIGMAGLEALYFLAYVLYAYSLLRAHLKQGHFSISLHWSSQLLLMGILVTLVDLVFVVFELIAGELSWYTGYATVVSCFIAVFYLAYSAFRNGFAAVLGHQIIEENALANATDPTKLSKFFSPEKVASLKAKLFELLADQKRYQDPDLSLSQLATEMDVSNKTLSQFINQVLDTSFYQLINEYRIEDVKEKLKSQAYKNYSIMGIASEAGFKSKTSFYRIFKQATQLSPGEYQKQGD